MPGKEIHYQTVFSLALNHSDHDKGGALFRVAPSSESCALLANLRWLFKPFPNGGWIIAPMDGDKGQPFLTISELTKFTFQVTATVADLQKQTIPFSSQGVDKNDPENIRWVLAGKPLLYLSNMDGGGKLDNKPANGNVDKQLLSLGASVSKEDMGIVVTRKFTRTPEKPPKPYIEIAAVNKTFNTLEFRQKKPLEPARHVSTQIAQAGQSAVHFDLLSDVWAAHELNCSNGIGNYTYPVYVEKEAGSAGRMGVIEIYVTPQSLDFAPATQYLAIFEAV